MGIWVGSEHIQVHSLSTKCSNLSTMRQCTNFATFVTCHARRATEQILSREMLLLLLPFNGCFPGEPRSAASPSGTPSPLVWKKPLGINRKGFLWARYPSCHPTISVKTLKGTESTNHSQWPGLIMVALCNRADHHIFILFLLLLFFPCLISAVGNWMSTILSHMVWP